MVNGQAGSYYHFTRDDQFAYPGTSQPNIISVRILVTTSSQLITLPNGIPCSTVTLYPESDVIYINWTGSAATTGNAKIPVGIPFTYQGPPILTFAFLGATATGYLSYQAW